MIYSGGDECSSGFQRMSVINFECNKTAGERVGPAYPSLCYGLACAHSSCLGRRVLNSGVSWLPLGLATSSPQVFLSQHYPPCPHSSRMHTYILFPSSSALHVCFGNLPSAGLAGESLCLEFCCRHTQQSRPSRGSLIQQLQVCATSFMS